MHPLFEEICRTPGVSSVQPHCFNRWQRQLRDEIQPLLDELEQLRAADAQRQAVADEELIISVDIPPRRKRGRPRKVVTGAAV